MATAAHAGPQPENVASFAWDATSSGAEADVLILLGEHADLSEATRLADRMHRRIAVWRALRDTAERSQRALLAWLSASSIPHRPFFIVNAVQATVDRQQLLALALRPDVERIVFNPRVELRPPADSPDDIIPKAIGWNVQLIGAPQVWLQGFTGQGLVVGVQDTGMRWTHEALLAKYRGYDATTGAATHDYHWHDAIHAGGTGGPCGTDSPFPCDDSGHGTHCTGTAVGGDPANDALGVAPGASWIGCRNMDEGWGTPASYLECFEFFLAPTPIGGGPATGDPALAPDVTSNSWACPPAEGCAWDVLQSAVEAQRAAGILPVVAAGNSGPNCGTVDAPPAIYDASYTVGASNANDAMARFSSRGPATDTGILKPDIVAPGVGIRSSTFAADDSYGMSNGTSMATPHVAGAVALLWSARPAYRGRIAETEDLLNRTALRLPDIVEGCGGDDVDGPNATWGHGRIDIARAVAEACEPDETRCDDGFDGDCDGAPDCADSDCVLARSCATEDFDGDGHPNGEDCLPFDPGTFSPALVVTSLSVTATAGGGAGLAWSDVSASSGTATSYDVASGTLEELRALRAAGGACVASGVAATEWTDAAPASDGLFYLVSATTACGWEPLSWGVDSLGSERPGCR